MVETEIVQAVGELNGLGWPAVAVIALVLLYRGYCRWLENRKAAIWQPAVEKLADKVINGRFRKLSQQLRDLQTRVHQIEEKL